MRYNTTAKVIQLFLTPYLKSFYKKQFPGKDCSKYVKNVKAEYRSMVERTPGIGGKPLEQNLYFAAYVFSINKADPVAMTPEKIDELTNFIFDSKLMVAAHKNKKVTMFSDKVQDARAKDAEVSQHSSYEMDWKFEYIKGKDEFWCNYTECGICKMGQKENMMHVVPCLCHMDPRNYLNDGGILHRTKTIADGDGMCDFHVTRAR